MNIGIIGGGPAGIIAAGFANRNKNNVLLIEKNGKLGKKLFITGKGRCNITNFSPIEDFFANIVTNREFLYSAFYSFTNRDIIKLLNIYGLQVKVERGNRVFPVSDKSSDVIKALEKFLSDKNINVLLNTTVKDIIYNTNKFTVTYSNGTQNVFDKLILATGGKSYSFTGSTGDGYDFAMKLGHNIEPLKPSLIPMEVHEDWVKQLQGLSLKNVSITGLIGKEKIFQEFGEMLFTHYGISGPIVLSVSHIINKHQDKRIKLCIDLKPALSEKELDKRILKDFKIYRNKQIKNGLVDLLPKRIIEPIINISSIDIDRPINQITKHERHRLINRIKALPLTFKKLKPLNQAIITSGGIDVSEVNPSTMESKLVPGLYFAGEILDVDGLTGGYNLQIAYSTGYIAGISV